MHSEQKKKSRDIRFVWDVSAKCFRQVKIYHCVRSKYIHYLFFDLHNFDLLCRFFLLYFYILSIILTLIFWDFDSTNDSTPLHK